MRCLAARRSAAAGCGVARRGRVPRALQSGFAPRRYVPRADIVAVGDARTAAWSYRARFEEVARITTLVSFYPDLSVDEIGGIQIGGIQLPEETIPAEA